MKSTTWKLRLEEEELARWKGQAVEEGMPLSQWIREACNSHVEDCGAENVRGNGAIRMVGGRAIKKGRKPRGIQESAPDNRNSVEQQDTAEAELSEHIAEEETDWAEAMIMRKSGHPRGCDCVMVCGKLRAALKGKR